MSVAKPPILVWSHMVLDIVGDIIVVIISAPWGNF
jgi:hypothetical protein